MTTRKPKRRQGPASVLDNPVSRLLVSQQFEAGWSTREVADYWGAKYNTVYRWRAQISRDKRRR